MDEEVISEGISVADFCWYELKTVSKTLQDAANRLARVTFTVAERMKEHEAYVAHLRRECDRLQVRVNKLKEHGND